MSIDFERREYRYGNLTRASLRDSPFEQFQLWLDAAVASPIVDPTAMTIATLDAAGRLWQRAVLLKGFDDRGFVFYTNLGSHKAARIAASAEVSLHFPWFQLDRQVGVAGTASPVSRAEVNDYFATRPRDSQLAAWASRQSTELASRAELEAAFAKCEARFAGGDVPAPEFWGGFRVAPRVFEFWQGGEMRLHDRFRYLPGPTPGSWRIVRLAP
ncbi:MAG: pyridoxamine 5'-phosphate oxidase [Porticoccaceae bacterium]